MTKWRSKTAGLSRKVPMFAVINGYHVVCGRVIKRSSDKEGIMKKIILIASALFLTGGCALASNGFGDGSPENGKQHSHYILSTHRQINLKNKANFYRGDGSVEGLPYRDVI